MPSRAPSLGAHDTRAAIARRVLEPLLLDDLRGELAAAEGDADALRALHDRLAGVELLDPACGRGAFLAAACTELRRLEQIVIGALGAPAALRVSASQFHGIEIDAAAAVEARAAVRRAAGGRGSAHVVHADALALAWEDVLPAARCTAVIGNPPFVAKQHRSSGQKAALRRTFAGARGHGELDYAAAWLELAARYVAGTEARAGFVATSSLVQGEQVAALWPGLLARGVRLDVAERPFAWTSDGPAAAVSVVVVGFSDRAARRRAVLGDGRGRRRAVRRISPYLVEGPDVVVRARRAPFPGGPPPIRFGSMPNDGGHLLLDAAEREALLDADPGAASHLRELLCARGLMGGRRRWCVWVPGGDAAALDASPGLRARADAVRRHRLASARAETRRLAGAAARFGEVRQPPVAYLCVPRHGAAARRCAPMAFAPPDVIAHDSTLTIAGADLELFGILQSAMFTAWLRGVAGRIRGDPRISAELVYNTFPWPPPGDGAIARAAAAVLAERARHALAPLARLYDPVAMPAGLARAHDALDAAVDARFGCAERREAARLGLLLARYASLASASATSPRVAQLAHDDIVRVPLADVAEVDDRPRRREQRLRGAP